MGAELAFGKRRESSDRWPWWLHSSVLALKAAPLYTESAWSRQLAYSCAMLSAGRSTMGWFPVGVWDAEPHDSNQSNWMLFLLVHIYPYLKII